MNLEQFLAAHELGTPAVRGSDGNIHEDWTLDYFADSLDYLSVGEPIWCDDEVKAYPVCDSRTGDVVGILGIDSTETCIRVELEYPQLWWTQTATREIVRWLGKNGVETTEHEYAKTIAD